MVLLAIPLYLLIGALLDYRFSSNPGEDIWVPMLFWPFIMICVAVAILFAFISYLLLIFQNNWVHRGVSVKASALSFERRNRNGK